MKYFLNFFIFFKIKRLSKKISEIDDMILKLDKKMKTKDYNTKVPENVRLENSKNMTTHNENKKMLEKYLQIFKNLK